jgi:adenylate kinase family enzyme
MQRVVILGRGASGKSTLARRLGGITRLPVIELDTIFWRAGLAATPPHEWTVIQEKLAAEDRWIMDGDLGPYDAVQVRLRRADTVIFLDFSLACCAWRAILRSRERLDFWRWLLAYRRRSRPLLMHAIAHCAPNAEVHVFRNSRAIGRFVTDLAKNSPL